MGWDGLNIKILQQGKLDRGGCEPDVTGCWSMHAGSLVSFHIVSRYRFFACTCKRMWHDASHPPELGRSWRVMVGVFVYDRSIGMCEVRAGGGLCYCFFVLTLLRMNFWLFPKANFLCSITDTVYIEIRIASLNLTKVQALLFHPFGLYSARQGSCTHPLVPALWFLISPAILVLCQRR